MKLIEGKSNKPPLFLGSGNAKEDILSPDLHLGLDRVTQGLAVIKAYSEQRTLPPPGTSMQSHWHFHSICCQERGKRVQRDSLSGEVQISTLLWKY